MASHISHDWCASNANVNAVRVAASCASAATARKWLRNTMPLWRGTSPASNEGRFGIASIATTKALQSAACGGGSVHAITRLSTAGRRHERPAQVVEHLPATEQRDGAAPAVDVGGAAPEHPRQQLPVAAHPTVRARRCSGVACGILVDEFDVRRESGPREDALEQVVAQQRILRHATRQRRLERVDVVDALADVRSLAAQVLVHVGHGGRVRVDAAGAGDETLVA